MCDVLRARQSYSTQLTMRGFKCFFLSNKDMVENTGNGYTDIRYKVHEYTGTKFQWFLKLGILYLARAGFKLAPSGF